MRTITADQADEAYTILVGHAGASDRDESRRSFVYHVSECARPTDEYRFMGKLGFGGKFRNNGNNDGIPYVDCYREDETPERNAAMITTNCLLAELFSPPHMKRTPTC